jgi:hypothetical protein
MTGAADGYDIYDRSEPPPPPGGPRLAFVGADPVHKRVDLRPAVDEGAIWNLALNDCPAGSKLTVFGHEQLPYELSAWLQKGNDLIRLEEDVAVALSGREIKMKLIIGTPVYLSRMVGELLPLKFELAQNFPNPFNPATSIKFTLPEPGRAALEIYNVLGQRVRTLVDEALPAGLYTVTWDGTDWDGHEVGSGIYFYRLKYGDFTEQRKMVLLK